MLTIARHVYLNTKELKQIKILAFVSQIIMTTRLELEYAYVKKNNYLSPLECDYSCLTCSGSSSINCLTCDPSTNRTITKNSSCICLPFFYEIQYAPICGCIFLFIILITFISLSLFMQYMLRAYIK
jgi:hypothetical protein